MQTLGPYQIRGELGRGAMGLVLRGYDPKLQREVAIKLLQSQLGGPSYLRFRREAESLARLDHPHVIGVHAVGEQGGRPYLVMPLVEGESLQSLLERAGVPPVRWAAEVGQKLASALGHVHQQGLLHRDVKPENVLLSSDGVPLLTDFGLVKDLESTQDALSRTGAAMGTPGYWSPEQAIGEASRVGPGTDVYGLGATLYALLTGNAPCPQTVGAAAVVLTVERPPVPPSELRPEVDPPLEWIVLKCLEKAPERRYPSGVELAADLERYLRGEPVQARPPQRGGRRRTVVALAALAALAAAGLGVVGRPQPEAADRSAAPQSAARQVTTVGLCEDARQALAAGDFDAAGVALEAALLADSACGEAFRERARLALLLGDPLAASEHASRALDCDPEDAVAMARRARALELLGRKQEALADVDRALDLAPACAEAHAVRGVILARWGARVAGDPKDDPQSVAAREARREEALREGIEAVALDPDSGIVYALLAEIRRRTLDLGAALQACDRALDLNAVDPGARRMRLLILVDQSSSSALREAEGLAEDMPGWGEAYAMLGQARRQVGKAEEALAAFDRALELAPDAPELYGYRARLHWDAMRFEAAEADYTRALELAPQRADLRLDRAVTRVNRQSFAAAIEDYDLLMREHGDEARLYGLRGASRVGVGDREGALADFEEQVRLGPDEAQHWTQLGIFRSINGDAAGAAHAFGEAIEIGPADSQMLTGRGEARLQLGDLEGALEDYRRAVQIDPSTRGRLVQLEAMAEAQE
jgi:serine/threonine-protein kinase